MSAACDCGLFVRGLHRTLKIFHANILFAAALPGPLREFRVKGAHDYAKCPKNPF